MLTKDELELLADYINNSDFKTLSDSFDRIVKQKQKNGSQTQDN